MTHPDNETFRLASYNVRNLFNADHVHAKKNREIRALAEVLTMLDADFVCIQEVASTEALTLVNERLKHPFDYCKVHSGNYYRGLHLGTLLRTQSCAIAVASHGAVALTDEDGNILEDYANPPDARVQKVSPLKIQRDILQTDLLRGADVLMTVFSVHLKSHGVADWRLLENDVIRGAEVRALIATVADYSARHPGQPVCIAGDLNETNDRPLLKKIVSELDLYDALEIDWVQTASTPSYSYQNYPSRARLDYLLLNKAARARYVENSACIHGSPSGRVASDHYPVSVEFRFSESQT